MPHSVGHHPFAYHAFAVIAFLILSLAFSCPLLANLNSSCSGDWDYFMALHEVPVLAVWEYGQFPLWNPYCGGGISLIGNPQAGYLSPVFILTSLLGVPAGLKLSVWLHTFVGLWGMWLLSGQMGIKSPARFAPPIIFMFSGAWALHLAAGHIVWLPAALLPWLFLAFLKSMSSRWWLVGAAALESLMVYEGGTYVLIFSMLFVGVYALLRTVEAWDYRWLGNFLAVNALAVFLSAPKLLPVLELLQNHPRPAGEEGSLSLYALVYFLTDRFSSLQRSFNGTGWWEFGAYIGILVIALYLFSFVLFKQHKALILASVFMLLLCLGNFGPLAPWTLLHKLPMLDFLKVPTRALIVLCFVVALLAGHVLNHFQNEDRPISKLIVGLVVTLILADLFAVNAPILGQANQVFTTPYWENLRFENGRPDPELYRIPFTASARFGQTVNSLHQPFTQISIPFSRRNDHGAWSDQYRPLMENRGVVDAYETIPFDRNALAESNPQYKGEFHLENAGQLQLVRWTPNSFWFHVGIERDNRLVINQNFADGWRTSTGTITSQGGLIAVDLPAGEYDLEVFYSPMSFWVGVYLFGGTIAAILFAHFVPALRRGKST